MDQRGKFWCAKIKDYVGEDGSQNMLFDEDDGFDEKELDIRKASEHNLLELLALQAYLACICGEFACHY